MRGIGVRGRVKLLFAVDGEVRGMGIRERVMLLFAVDGG